MNETKVKNKVFKYIKENEATSFVEIENIFNEIGFDYKGDGAYTSGGNDNVIFWIGWNKEAFNVISEMKRDGLIEMAACPPLFYMIDGKGLNLPIATTKNIKTDHWLPVTFSVK